MTPAAPTRAGRVVNDHSTFNMTVNQLPGESQAELADRIMREMERKKRTQQRGSLVDAA